MTEALSASLPAALANRTTVSLRRCCAADLTIATAEGCTGGQLASVLKDVHGVSHSPSR